MFANFRPFAPKLCGRDPLRRARGPDAANLLEGEHRLLVLLVAGDRGPEALEPRSEVNNSQ